MKTALIFSPEYYSHNTGRGHPESARRLRVLVKELKKRKFHSPKNWAWVRPNRALPEVLERVHGIEYIRLVEKSCGLGGGTIDLRGDTIVSSESYEVALCAVGGTTKAADLVMNNKYQNAFVLARPPGHHAKKHEAGGFCIFNNVAIGAKHLLSDLDCERILILDIDCHHGDGTQAIFYETDEVLFISLHEDPMVFPGAGFIDEIGEGEGLGYTVNIPLPYGTTDGIYLKAVDEIVKPIVEQYRPKFMFLSAGLDCHHADPIGNLALSVDCYQGVFRTAVDLSGLCSGRLVATLEGGYGLDFIGEIAVAGISEMSGDSFETQDKALGTQRRIEREGEDVITEVKRTQRAFWNL